MEAERRRHPADRADPRQHRPAGFLNAPQLAAAKLAVKEINAAGGHKGKPVELLPETISADTAAQAKALVAAKADVVIGPTDSSRAPAAIDVLSNAKVAMISPANAASGLSSYESGGYYFRTVGSRRRPGPRPGQARQGRRRRRPSPWCTRKALRQGRLRRRGRRGQGGRTRARGRRRVHARARRSRRPLPRRQRRPTPSSWFPADGAQGAIAELNNAGLAGKKLILSDGAVNQYGSGLGSSALDGARGILPGTFASAHFQGELVAVDPGAEGHDVCR